MPGQGLLDDGTSLGSGSQRLAALSKHWATIHTRSQDLRYRWSRTSSCQGKRSKPGTLCGLDVSAADSQAALLLMASPWVYDARNPEHAAGASPIGVPKDQGKCNSCVAHTMTALAEAAMASRLGVSASSLPPLSPRDLFFCGQKKGQCNTGWTPQDALHELVSRDRLKREECLPFKQLATTAFMETGR